jgi:hypothetical protein
MVSYTTRLVIVKNKTKRQGCKRVQAKTKTDLARKLTRSKCRCTRKRGYKLLKKLRKPLKKRHWKVSKKRRQSRRYNHGIDVINPAETKLTADSKVLRLPAAQGKRLKKKTKKSLSGRSGFGRLTSVPRTRTLLLRRA